MHILDLSTERELRKIMQEIKVDQYGIKIMLPKAQARLVKIPALSYVAANILKQEMLSCGGDAAIAKGSLTGKTKKSDCLLIGSVSQLLSLAEKLNRQPFGLKNLGEELGLTLKNYDKGTPVLKAGRYRLNLRSHTHIMGIMNITSDSFSGDGLLNLSLNEILAYATRLVDDGADIIDIGGESSRPGANNISLKEELKRIIPVIKLLAKKIKLPISVDTSKPEVAKIATEEGASIINDITGLRRPEMAEIAAKNNAAVVIMHMQGNPSSMQKLPKYDSLIDEIIIFLRSRIDLAKKCGIGSESIVVDPGIGFGKTVPHNIEILKRLTEFKSLGMPILVGTSRKSFIGKIIGRTEPDKRIFGTVASCVNACLNGADILRVHDVKTIKEALKITDKVKLWA